MSSIIRLFSVSLLLALFFTSCSSDPCGSTKEKFLSNYDKFLDNVRKKDLSYSADEWETLDKKFEKFVKECRKVHENDLSISDQKQLWAGSAKYYYMRYGTGIVKAISDQNDDVLKYVIENSKDAVGESSIMLKNLLNEVGDNKELQQALEQGMKLFENNLEGLMNQGLDALDKLKDLDINIDINTEEKEEEK